MATGSMAVASPATASGISSIIAELQQFEKDCERRYLFNNRWDVALTVAGLLLSIAVAATGLFRPWVAPILGAVVAAVLSAQKAFPFGQRAMFYRLLIGQAQNLMTRLKLGIISEKNAVDAFSNLRMDFAQQLPRGSGANDQASPETETPAKA